MELRSSKDSDANDRPVLAKSNGHDILNELGKRCENRMYGDSERGFGVLKVKVRLEFQVVDRLRLLFYPTSSSAFNLLYRHLVQHCLHCKGISRLALDLRH